MLSKNDFWARCKEECFKNQLAAYEAALNASDTQGVMPL
jgi:hypothetical protein